MKVSIECCGNTYAVEGKSMTIQSNDDFYIKVDNSGTLTIECAKCHCQNTIKCLRER